MDWISSLLKARCPFCRSTLGSPATACVGCAQEIGRVVGQTPLAIPADSEARLMAHAAVHYEDWNQKLVLLQKEKLHRVVVRWMASALRRAIPSAYASLPVVWIPGRWGAGLHLTEALALELQSLGISLYPIPLLKRRRLGLNTPQKALGLRERQARDVRELFAVTHTARLRHWLRQDVLSPVEEVLLLDDIITTGATLTGCARLLQEELGIHTRAVLAFAWTPLRFRKPQRSAGPEPRAKAIS